jgi:hypothetical protein
MSNNITPARAYAIGLWRTTPLIAKIFIGVLLSIGAFHAIPLLLGWGLVILIYLGMAIVPILAVVGAYYLIKKFFFGG